MGKHTPLNRLFLIYFLLFLFLPKNCIDVTYELALCPIHPQLYANLANETLWLYTPEQVRQPQFVM